MTNKQKAMLRVAGVFGVAVASSLVMSLIFVVAPMYFTVQEVFGAISAVLLAYVFVSLTRMIYESELDKLNRLDQLNKGE